MTKRHKNHLSLLWNRRRAGIVAVAVVAMGSGVAAAPGHHGGRHSVQPGESIQAAVAAARPGDTIVVAPGTYRESVEITTSGVTLRGSGPGTVIAPPAGTEKRAESACAKAGNGICVTGTDDADVTGVTIRSLAISGFTKGGLWASRTEGLTVRDVTAEKNGTWGLGQEKSTRAVFRGNTARGNGDAGIMLTNIVGHEAAAIDSGGTVVADNDLSDNRLGVMLKRIRNVSTHANEITANCAGIFVVSDESRPGSGDITIRSNTIHRNNKFCAATPRLPAIQGSGIVLTGSDATVIKGNSVRDHKSDTLLAGGIVLAESYVGAVNTDNVIEHNTVTGNVAADLIDRGNGSGNTFARNECASSKPAGLC
ncbi:right-handed parallel beta-helix repeat-containing protein [Streptomyces sp. NPDC020875]|uniref:right-handed parallel beta-helix repeat-containing protein n=1 Tax=Streptomyces sp. NPDC020875 TaxID=3154898 RepID=UPI0033FFE74F